MLAEGDEYDGRGDDAGGADVGGGGGGGGGRGRQRQRNRERKRRKKERMRKEQQERQGNRDKVASNNYWYQGNSTELYVRVHVPFTV